MNRVSRPGLAALAGAVVPLAVLSVSGIVPACGGTHGAPPTLEQVALPPDTPSPPYLCSQSAPYEFYMIEDFESGAATDWYTNNEVCYECQTGHDQCSESGTWDVWLDGDTPCATWSLATCLEQCLAIQSSPSYGADPLPATLIPNGGRCGSEYAMNLRAGPFVHWGSSIGRRKVTTCPDGGQTCGFDASSYDGVALWLRSPPGYANSARVIVSDRNTDTAYNMTLAQPLCNPSPPSAYPSGGCDKFGTYINVTDAWTLYLLPFQEMRQSGWGIHQAALDTTGILGIEVDVAQGTWDMWMDDIAFYRLKGQ